MIQLSSTFQPHGFYIHFHHFAAKEIKNKNVMPRVKIYFILSVNRDFHISIYVF